MNLLQRLEHWGETHHPKWIDIGRFALGIFLCFKGVEFLENMSTLLIPRMSDRFSGGSFSLLLISHYIAFAHLLGGFLLAIGLLTRFACIIQIPVLLGAVIFINSPSGIFQPFSEWSLSLVVLIGLIYFLIAGNGPWSMDYLIEKERRERMQ